MVNLANAEGVSISDAINPCEIAANYTAKYITLGEYETPERTKEVFDDLCSKWSFRACDYYEMPEK